QFSGPTVWQQSQEGGLPVLKRLLEHLAVTARGGATFFQKSLHRVDHHGTAVDRTSLLAPSLRQIVHFLTLVPVLHGTTEPDEQGLGERIVPVLEGRAAELAVPQVVIPVGP